MRLIIITFLFTFFSPTYSFADNSKITPDDVERFINIKFENFRNEMTQEEYENYKKNDKYLNYNKEIQKIHKKREIIKKEIDFQKRINIRNIAKCAYEKYFFSVDAEITDECMAKVIRTVMTYSEKSKKKRPGDIFYVLDIFDSKNASNMRWNWNLFVRYTSFTKDEKKPKNLPGMECNGGWYDYKGKEKFRCISFNKSFYKKFEKFKKNPTKEKIIGNERVKYLKRLKMTKEIRKKLGIPQRKPYGSTPEPDFARIAYPLLGDMLNAVVVDVIKNYVDPDLRKRRILLEKYSLILSRIDKKLEADDYKSLDKEKIKLAKAFKALKKLTTTDNDIVNKVDQAVNIISDINKEIEISVLKSKNNDQEKLFTRSLVFFMDTLIDSILDEIPEKYFAVTKPSNSNLFHEIELKELENIVEKMVSVNRKIKSDKLAKSAEMINKNSKFLDTNDITKKLESIGIKDSSSKPYTHETASKIATDHIIDNLDKDILKESKKILKELQKDSLKDITEQASQIAKEVAKDVASNPQTKSLLDRKIGNHSLKTLIGAHRRGYIDLGIGNR